MWKLLKYMKAYKKEAVCAPLFKLLEALFELFVPLVMAKIIDIGIAQGDRPYIVRMCLLMAALGLIGLVCSITAQYFSAKAAVGFAARLRHELFAHIQSLSFSEMDVHGTSTLITRMTSDINQVQSGTNLFLRLFMRSPFIVFGAMIMAFTIDVKAALIFVVVIPILCVIVFGIMLASIPLYKKVQERLDNVTGMTRENLQGVRVIRAFRQEKKEIETFDAGNEALVKIQMFSGRISALMNPLTYIVINGGLVVLLYHAGCGRSAGQLYVADPGRTGQAGEPDHQRDEGDRLWKPYSECHGTETGHCIRHSGQRRSRGGACGKAGRCRWENGHSKAEGEHRKIRF